MSKNPPPLPDTEISKKRQAFHFLIGATLFWPVSVIALALFHVDAATWLSNKITGTQKTTLTKKFFNKVDDFTNHHKTRRVFHRLLNAAMSFVALKYYAYAIPKEIEKAQEKIKEIQERIEYERFGSSGYYKTNWVESVAKSQEQRKRDI